MSNSNSNKNLSSEERVARKREELSSWTTYELINQFNRNVGCRGWVSAKGVFLSALIDVLVEKGIDVSNVTGRMKGLKTISMARGVYIDFDKKLQLIKQF